MACRLAAFDRTGHLDSPAEQEQFFGQRGLAGIGMADDGKGAPVTDFAGDIGHGCGSGRGQWEPRIISHAAQCLDGMPRQSSLNRHPLGQITGVQHENQRGEAPPTRWMDVGGPGGKVSIDE